MKVDIKEIRERPIRIFLDDGAEIELRVHVSEVEHVDGKKNPDGTQKYTVRSVNFLRVVDSPPEHEGQSTETGFMTCVMKAWELGVALFLAIIFGIAGALLLYQAGQRWIDTSGSHSHPNQTHPHKHDAHEHPHEHPSLEHPHPVQEHGHPHIHDVEMGHPACIEPATS